MIHIFIGTKAQYVKTAPVIKELDKRGIEYNLIDSGQHAALAKDYRDYFKIRAPDRILSISGEDIKTVSAMLVWFGRILSSVMFSSKQLLKNIFRGEKGVCLVHGDTPTTLLSVLAAKRSGLKVVHLESGLRSYNIFHPFPEELIRMATMRWSDYLLAPSPWAFDNLKKMGLSHKSFLVGGNSNIDALEYAKSLNSPLAPGLSQNEKFVIVSIHRAETILNRNRLQKIVELVQRLGRDYKVLLCVHPPTRKQLEKYGFINGLQSTRGVILRDLLPYPQFIQSIKKAHFIVTDGGSVQEESYYLGVPCLLMRNRTERLEGINKNVYISEFDDRRIDYFLNKIEQFRCSDYQKPEQSPSTEIVDILLNQILPAQK